ncbi:MAG: Fimbrial protein precursor, partial [Pseudomonadota bacterium]
AILAAIAIPSYSQYVQKTRRTDGQEKLLDMAAQQERWFFSNNQYAKQAAIDSVGGANSADEHYTVAITTTGEPPTTYTLVATAVGSQAYDTSCATLTLTNTGLKGATPSSNANLCWQTK